MQSIAYTTFFFTTYHQTFPHHMPCIPSVRPLLFPFSFLSSRGQLGRRNDEHTNISLNEGPDENTTRTSLLYERTALRTSHARRSETYGRLEYWGWLVQRSRHPGALRPVALGPHLRSFYLLWRVSVGSEEVGISFAPRFIPSAVLTFLAAQSSSDWVATDTLVDSGRRKTMAGKNLWSLSIILCWCICYNSVSGHVPSKRSRTH